MLSSTSASHCAGRPGYADCTAVTFVSRSSHGVWMGMIDVVAATRHVGPAGWPDVVHRDFEAVGPEQVERHIAHQLELGLVGAGLDPLKDVGPRWRFGIEVPPDDRIELLDAFEGGEVEIRKAIGRKNDLAMLVEFKGMHCRSPISLRSVRVERTGCGGGQTEWVSHVQTAVYPPNLSSDVARGVRGQEVHHSCDLPRSGQPAHRDAALDAV